MHPYWTPFWFLKFGIGITGGLYFGFTKSAVAGLGFFFVALIGITLFAQLLFLLLRAIAPGLVERWELEAARKLLFGSHKSSSPGTANAKNLGRKP